MYLRVFADISQKAYRQIGRDSYVDMYMDSHTYVFSDLLIHGEAQQSEMKKVKEKDGGRAGGGVEVRESDRNECLDERLERMRAARALLHTLGGGRQVSKNEKASSVRILWVSTSG